MTYLNNKPMANHISRIVLVVSVCASISSAFDEIPDFLITCRGSDPKRDECVARSANKLAPLFNEGIPAYDLVSLNPFEVKNFVISPKSSGLLIKLNEMRMYNSHNYTVFNASSPAPGWGKKFLFSVLSPRYYINGTYTVDGELVLLKLEGHGPAVFILDDVVTHFDVTFDPKRGVDESPYITRFSFKFEYKRCRVKLSNLFGGDQLLGETINAAINQNIDVFAGELIPMVETRLAALMRPKINKFLTHFSNAQLFAD